MKRVIVLLMLLIVTGTARMLQAASLPPACSVELTASSGGRITPNRDKLNLGMKNVKFQIRPDRGFVIDTVILNGTALGRVAAVTIPVVEGPISIVAMFKSGLPTVDAGSNVTTHTGVPVTLQPSVLPALPGDALLYDWAITKKPVDGKASLNDRHAVTPAFTALSPGYYEVRLQVADGRYKAADVVGVQVLPSPDSFPPVARIAAPSTALVGQAVTLNGSGSTDQSGRQLSYGWKVVSQPQGSMAALSDTSAAMPTIMPDLPGTYVVILVVSNGLASSETRFALITARQNVGPVASAGEDQSVSVGKLVALDGSASYDADGDAITYSWSFQACPQGICPTLNNSSTARPSFVAGLAGDYLLNLTASDGSTYTSSDTVHISSSMPSPQAQSLLEQKWQYGVFGTNIGSAGMHVADLDGDGAPEVVASASAGGFGGNAMWYILRKSATGSYEQVWRSEMYGATLVRLLVADITKDGGNDVIVGLSDGTVMFYDGITRTEVGRVATTKNLVDVAVADIDGDGQLELVTTNGAGIFVYSVESGELKWSLPVGGGTSLAVGNVDGDAAQEIVITSANGHGYVIDGLSRAIEWEYLNGFGSRVRLGDLDGDGMMEVVGAGSWYKITVFDADVKSPMWEIATTHDISALLVTDVTGDGKAEIVYGAGQWGRIHAINATTHQELWSINNPDHGVQGLAFGDVDQDGTREVLWGAGGSSTGADHLYVAAAQTGTVKWQSMHVDGPLSAVDVGDVDGDGEDDIVMVSRESDSGYAEGVVHIFDARTHDLKYREKLGVMDWMGVRSVRIGDVDGVGRNEFVVTTANIYGGIIRVYDGVSRTVKRDSASYDGNYFSALAIADIDNDGRNEIIAGQGREHTGATGVYLIVFDGETLQEKWRSVDIGNYWGCVRDIKVADIDGDGHKELIAAVGSQLIVYDGVTHILKYLGNQPAVSLEVDPGMKEILVGRADGKIDVLDGMAYTLKRTVTASGNSQIDGLRLADLTGDGVPEWLVTQGGKLEVLDGTTQTLLWNSAAMASSLGAFNHLVVRDTDGNGRNDVFLGDNTGLYHFEVLQ